MEQNGSWQEALDESKLANNRGRAGLPGGETVLLVRAEGGLFALESKCPHLGCSLERGTLDGFLLKCPCHDWIFDIRTGGFTAAREIKLKT
jgi:nitrite reductase/ring-hydroxylating ferredoxin subunit